MRVFHGITGAAGQPASIVQALRREGIDAQNYLVGANKYAYGQYLFDIVRTEQQTSPS